MPAEESTGRTYALKRMRKSAVVQCPEHVFCEQAITKNVAHPFCIRQYASFQVGLQWVRESGWPKAGHADGGLSAFALVVGRAVRRFGNAHGHE